MQQWLTVFFCAMLPVVELRGAVPIGLSMGLPHLPVLVLSVLGNMVPVPFVILCIRRIFVWLRARSPRLEHLVSQLESRAQKKAALIHKYQLFGLFLLVAIPLPGTGAWTGALVAAVLDLRLKHAFPAIFAGVTVAGILMYALSIGVGSVI